MRPPKWGVPQFGDRGGRLCWELPDKEWLEYHYAILGKTVKQIAEEVGACRPTVTDWLWKLHIYVRTKSETDQLRPGQSERCFRERARILLEELCPQVCAVCGRDPSERQIEVHHIDEDPFNNDPDNLQWLCRGCHTIFHRNTDKGGDAR